MPFVNWSLYVFIVLAVVMFKSSTNLASAYGIAVTLDADDHHGDDLLRHPLPGSTHCRCALQRPAFSSSSTSPSLPPACSSCWPGAGFPIVIGARHVFVLMITWTAGPPPAQPSCATAAIPLPLISSNLCSSVRPPRRAPQCS